MTAESLQQVWAREILSSGNQLKSAGLIPVEVNFDRAVTSWLIDGQHGADHSLSVYQGALELCRIERLPVDEEVDKKLKRLAVGHDLVQFFPEAENGVADHAMIVALLARRSGLGDREFAQALAYHDLTLNLTDPKQIKRQTGKLSLLGKIFHDADKLYGLGFSENPEQLAVNVVVRNRAGAFKEDGWYLIRSDLTREDRLSQRYGMRWFSDRLASVGKEIFGIQCLTGSGIKIAATRKQAFIDTVLEQEYGREFDETQAAVAWWSENSGIGLKLELVGKNFTVQEFKPRDIMTVIKLAFNSSLGIDGGEKYATRPYGVMIRLSYNGEMKLIDPSIARFTSKTDFLKAVKQAVSVWEGK
jgi:hypothetical protein